MAGQNIGSCLRNNLSNNFYGHFLSYGERFVDVCNLASLVAGYRNQNTNASYLVKGEKSFLLTLNLEKNNPDLVLLAIATEDLELGSAPGIEIMAEALRKEMESTSDIPLIDVTRYGE